MSIDKFTKRDSRNSKIIQKEVEDLQREVQAMNRRFDQRANHQEDEEVQFTDEKGRKWWHRFDLRNFRNLTIKEYQQLRDITTSGRVLQQMPTEALPNTYAQYKIVDHYDLFQQTNLIHVLFKTKNPRYRCLASYSLQESAIIAEERQAQEEEERFRVSPSGGGELRQGIEGFSQIKMAMAGYNQDEEFCRTVDHYKRSLDKHSNKKQLQMELYLWEKQLHSISKENQLVWDRIGREIRKGARQEEDQGEIREIRDHLMWGTVLKYFQNGYADKTDQQLQQLIDSQRLMKPAKSKDTNTKKFFQTDCKICFCSFNNDSNQVLYCDGCSTSFHIACYGLQELPKQDPYFCDYCKVTKHQNFKKMVCQLCNKTKYPIKQIQGHYYHMTCLMFFNLVAVEGGKFVLRKGFSHGKIVQMVVESQLGLRECQFCGSSGGEVGIRMKCSFAGCTHSAHPICAYIYGCKFWVKRDANHLKLDIGYHCNTHDSTRDWKAQTYLRRYMCNFRKTSQMSRLVFQQKYQEQLKQMKQTQKRSAILDGSRIIAKTKFINRKLTQEQQKRTAVPSQMQTQTMMMLQKLKRKRQ